MNLLNKIKSLYNKYTDFFRPMFVLTIICLVTAAALSVTNMLTATRIENLANQNKNREMSALLPAQNYREVAVSNKNSQLFLAQDESNFVGYVVTASAKGYGGDINIMAAINPDKKIIGVSILSAADETPGLGANVTKPEFYSQFAGLSANITAIKNTANPANNEIKTVTGATISSKAVTKAVNQALQIVEEYEKSLNTEGVQ